MNESPRPRLSAGAVAAAGLIAFVAALSAAQAQVLTKPVPPTPAAEFPFESRFVEVHGSKMHYVEAGEGDPILFLHGNPTSSYLWRNIIPHLKPQGRAIAPDLIGMGRSDKPALDYTYADHLRYVEGFIAALELEDLTLVVHDWGSALGLDYASRHSHNVVGVAFMEAIIPPAMPMAGYEAMGAAGGLFRAMRTPGQGEEMVLNQNVFVEQILPGAIVRELGDAEMAAYRAPFPTPESRKPVLVWPRQLPIAGEPEETVQVVTAIGKWMLETEMPLLHLWASPGALNPPEMAQWLAQNTKNLQSTFIGTGSHYVQEDHPEIIGLAIADWRRRLYRARE